MTDTPHPENPGPDLPLFAEDLLADAALWEPVDVDLENSVLASIQSEIAASGNVGEPQSDLAPVVELSERRRNRDRLVAAVLGAAAALVLAFGLMGLIGQQDRPDLELVLAGTDLAPAAEANAEITALDEGTRILLDVSGLPPAEPGFYYEAWLRVDADLGVSAGTFHLRNGSSAIELWSGVTVEDFPLVTVTLQPEGMAASSGRVVLAGRVGG